MESMGQTDDEATEAFDPLRYYVQEQHFRRGLSVLHELREAGELRVLVAARGMLQFEIREEHEAVDTTLANHGLTFEQLQRVVWDVSDTLLAAIAGVGADAFAARRSDPNRFEDEETEDPELSRSKYAEAVAAFDIEDLRRRAWIKETSPVRIPRRMQWDVLSKHVSAGGKPPNTQPVRFGALRFVLDSSRGLARDETEFVMTVDKEDVGFMLDSLGEFLRVLEEEDG